jgi:hypothetical protein
MRTIRSAVRALVVAGVVGTLVAGCATGRGRAPGLGVSDSGNSSAGSADSSAGSGNSSQASGNSSNPGNSSDSGGSSEQSSQQSSRNSTEGTSAGTSKDGGQSSAVASATAMLLTTVGGIGLSIYATVRAGDGDRERAVQSAMVWLRANHRQLQQDLALGAGPVVDDLANAAQIRPDHRAEFARVLQRNRKELLALADPETLDTARTRRFLSSIGALTSAHPLLRENAERFLERYQEAG